jgi:hypothetical protein
MASTCWLLAREAPGAGIGIAIVAATVALLTLTRVPPMVLIFACGAIGAFVDW